MQDASNFKTKCCYRPGQPGTKGLVAQYGDRLVCVRYRYDEISKKRLKTVELIIDKVDWHPQKVPISHRQSLVSIRVGFQDSELHNWIDREGGVWNSEKRCWDIAEEKAFALGLDRRLIPSKPL